MSFLVVVDTTKENKISKYQLCETQEEANDHALKVKDKFASVYVVDKPQNYNFDYLVADVSNKTVTFDQARWDSDQNAIASTQYQRDRATAYASLQEQADMQYWDSVNGTTMWQDHIAEVKEKYPKGDN